MSSKSTHILAFETSCDETAASVVRKDSSGTSVLSNVVSSQIALHAPFGGVVPDLAAREHTKNIIPVLHEALALSKLSPKDIQALAVTQGPGLIPALLIGVTAAKTLAYAWKKPLMGIHHIEGHIYANFIQHANDDTLSATNISFPLLALIVSGGHTQLVLMRDHFQYEILGETLDDAAGEAFDKVAKMLGLPYPGGPIVAKRADTFHNRHPKRTHPALADISESPKMSDRIRNNMEIEFPRPMLHSKDYNFSFSGLKTAVLYTLKKYPEIVTNEFLKDEVCFEFQEAVVDILVDKTAKALEQFQPKTLVIAGGVSANTTLRSRIENMVTKQFPHTHFSMPDFAYSLDNAAMIASAAAFRWDRMNDGQKAMAQTNWKTLAADANLKLSSLSL